MTFPHLETIEWLTSVLLVVSVLIAFWLLDGDYDTYYDGEREYYHAGGGNLVPADTVHSLKRLVKVSVWIFVFLWVVAMLIAAFLN